VTPPPWRITLSATKRYAYAMRWAAEDEDRARRELLAMAARTHYVSSDRYDREQWRSPSRSDGGLRWVITPRSEDGLAKVVWVGHSRPSESVWQP
jgi:hypothetical protein